MVITYNGLEFFKVQSGNLTLAFNPVSKKSNTKISPPRFKTDIALVSLNHPDFNGVEGLIGRDDKETFVIDGAGEYEVEGVFIKGFSAVSNYDGTERISTIYKVTIEGINLCFLGGLSSKNISEKALSQMDDIDILFVPIGGNGVMKAADAHKLAVKISAGIIIPMHYGLAGDKDALTKFFKEEGGGKVAEIEKLSIKKSNLALKDGEIVVLKS